MLPSFLYHGLGKNSEDKEVRTHATPSDWGGAVGREGHAQVKVRYPVQPNTENLQQGTQKVHADIIRSLQALYNHFIWE